MVGLQQVNGSGAPEYRQPMLSGVGGDVGVPGKIGQGGHLSGPCRARAKKANESALVADPGKITDIALQIGPDVRADSRRRPEWLITPRILQLYPTREIRVRRDGISAP